MCNCDACVGLDSEEDLEDADTLIFAGWRWEIPADHAPHVYQWKWRSPPKRKGSKGKLYHSTRQAYNALMREDAEALDAWLLAHAQK